MPGADAASLLKRLDQLKSRRSVVEDVWRDCFNFTYPLRGSLLEARGTVSDATQNASNAKTRQAELLDSTSTDAARILASGLMSGSTPSNSRWPGFECEAMSHAEKVWLDNAADTIWELIHASNYDAVGYECMLDLVIAGMSPLFMDEDSEGGGFGFSFEQWPLANCYFASSRASGPVDTVFNEYQLSAEQAVNTYGENMVSPRLREIAATKPDEMVQFVRCVYPRDGEPGRFARNMPIASVHIECHNKHIVRESGYHEMPIGVPRWSPIPGSAYAFGPVYEALPDIKTLNKEIEYVLANADLAIAGMWGAVDDGVLNPRTVRVGPRKVIVMAEKDNLWPLAPAAKFDIAVLEIERLQRSIRRVLMADQLEPQQKAGTPPTATEIVVRVELIRQLLGPIYGRMQSEYLQWMLTRAMGMAFRAGVLGNPPDSLRSKAVTIKYFSPIARSQKAVDVAAMDRYEMSLANTAAVLGESALDNYDWDGAARERANLLGVPAKLIPEAEAVDASRQQRTQQAQAQQAMAMVADAAGKGAQ